MHSLIACILFIFIRPLISINTEITGSLENASLETEQIDPVSNDLKKNNENSSAENIQGYFAQQSRTPHIFSHVKHFQLVCCMGGIPQLSHPELARNFNIEKSISYTIAKDKEYDNTANFDSNADCRLFRGSFMVPQPRLLLGLPIELSYTSNIVCKCPELTLGHALDRSCRRLPSCQNNGFRSLLDPKQCFCLEPFFGERCERICDRGRRLRGMDGRDYCNCLPFYHGIECREPICLNGGRSLFDARGCECLPPFIGFHCEFDGNRTQRFEFEANVGNAGARSAGNSRFRHNFDSSENVGEMFSTRDISGTVFSIVMIIVLVLSMYMLMKHRMVQTRHMNRRTDLLGACNIPPSLESSGGTNEFSFPANFTLRDENNQVRRLELLPNAEESVMATGLGRYSLPPLMRRLTPFFTSGDNPPPYALNQRAQRSRNLPPLPSYEDATKLPAIRTELRDENTHLGVQEHQELCSSELTNESRIQINHQSQTEENNVEPINEGNIECELSELLDVNKKTTEEPIK